MRNIGIISTGGYLPSNSIDNNELSKLLSGLSPEWILEKTGIKKRYIMDDQESASGMAYNAIVRALEYKNINSSEVGLLIVASFSQDYLLPSMSAKLHNLLGLSGECQIVDINTACVGLITGISIAFDKMKYSDRIKYGVIVGVEALSRYTNINDENTSIFFSDGASAVVLGDVPDGGIIDTMFYTDSSTYESVRLRGGGSSYPMKFADNINKSEIMYIEQNGLATWKQAITNLPTLVSNMIKVNNYNISEIDFIIFHQANKLLINYLVRKLKIDSDKTYINVDEIGNTGAASIGLALDDVYRKDLINRGQLIVLAGVGAGFNFGSLMYRNY